MLGEHGVGLEHAGGSSAPSATMSCPSRNRSGKNFLVGDLQRGAAVGNLEAEVRLNDQKLAVTTYRGLFPTVEIPAGSHGRLTLIYRPPWLVWGGSLAVGCGLIVLFGLIAASRYSSSTARDSGF